MIDGPDVRLGLRRYLGARLGPLVILLIVVTCVSAPLAVFAIGQQALRVEAQGTARQVAELIKRDAEIRPRLWKYDSMKIINHIRSYEMRAGIARVDVVDAAGYLVDPADDLAGLDELHALWESAPVVVGKETVGAVWVAASTKELRRDTLVLFVAFAALALVLGGLMYGIPIRAMGRAQAEIGALVRRLRESQAALAELNEGLEQQVESRATELRKAYADLRELSTRAVKLQEAERRGIARELHDSAGQALTAIRIHLQLISDMLGAQTPPPKAADLARRTMSMVDGTVEEIRRAVNQLGPAVLDDVGLGAAVERAADDLHETTGVEVQCEVELSGKLDASVETTCYRIVQESLTNVARHSEASSVEIRVWQADGAVALKVRDDGKGFDPGQSKGRRRGLVGMRERVELLGGWLEVRSAEGEGTTVEARIPAAGEW